VPPVGGLSSLKVQIPDTILRGQDAVFNCSYTLEDEKLYAVKWYRGTYEIFRYVPSDNPPTKAFPLQGYNVSMRRSTGNTMVLHSVNFENSGAYSCEVIADITFHTLIQTKNMLVIDLPDERPRITGVKGEYDVGDGIKASCTSWQSHPPANLSWFINGEPAREGYLQRHQLREEFDGTFTTVLGLHFDVSGHHFRPDGKMTLKCTSSMLSIYWQSREVEIQESTFSSYSIPAVADKRPASSNGGKLGNLSGGKRRNSKKKKQTHQRKQVQVDPKKMPVGELKPNVMSSSKAATFGSTGYSSVVIMTSSLILVALLSTVITSSSVAIMSFTLSPSSHSSTSHSLTSWS